MRTGRWRVRVPLDAMAGRRRPRQAIGQEQVAALTIPSRSTWMHEAYRLREQATVEVLASGPHGDEVMAVQDQTVSAHSSNKCASVGGDEYANAIVDSLSSGRVSDLLAELVNFPIPSESLLRRFFELTPAETRLAQALTCGESLEEVAERLNVKMTTARTQLAAIFAKTSTNRQAQLVAILNRVAHLK
jgi:DNA-binding NarL/FixJ family response regulator